MNIVFFFSINLLFKKNEVLHILEYINWNCLQDYIEI